jgi:hypothetical protein
MKYANGNIAKMGDRVRLWKDYFGTIVCSIDDDEYTSEFPKDEWGYLKVGILIRADNGALIHYVEADEDFQSV